MIASTLHTQGFPQQALPWLWTWWVMEMRLQHLKILWCFSPERLGIISSSWSRISCFLKDRFLSLPCDPPADINCRTLIEVIHRVLIVNLCSFKQIYHSPAVELPKEPWSYLVLPNATSILLLSQEINWLKRLNKQQQQKNKQPNKTKQKSL